MTLLLALSLSAAHAAKDPCAERSESEQQAFTESLETLHLQVAESQTTPGAKDLSAKAAKEMLGHVKKGELCTQEDRFWAAMNLLQGHKVEFAEEAFGMAEALMQERHPRGPWLVALAYDRKAIARGALQTYGSQTGVQNGRRCLIWTDLQFADADRTKMGHSKLAATMKQILEANGFQGVQPTVLELKNRDLWCKPEPWDGSRSDLRDPYDGRR